MEGRERGVGSRRVIVEMEVMGAALGCCGGGRSLESMILLPKSLSFAFYGKCVVNRSYEAP